MVKRTLRCTSRMTRIARCRLPFVTLNALVLAVHGRLIVLMTIGTGELLVTRRIGMTVATVVPFATVLS